tara:strand:- start:275 stop:1537 length:1263 start_codon:yes stop_codon:yes gene_type:complete
MIDYKKHKTFCPYPIKGAVIEGSNPKIKPCCRFVTENHQLDTGVPFNYNNIWKDIRAKMLNGEYVSGCVKCYKQEADGNRSMRTNALRNFVDNINDVNHSMRGPFGYRETILKTELEYLEIESGRYCNLKCRSCSPNLSTSWDEDLKNNKDAEQNFYGGDKDVHPKMLSRPSINEAIAELTYNDCKHLKEIKVTGGEPFLSDAFLKFLENLVEWDISKNITLDIFTNCSFFPKEKYRVLLPKFKCSYINLSLDAIGKRAEFIRKKCNWNIVEKVSQYWDQESLDHDNIKLKISHTVSLFNVLYLNEFIMWCATNFNQDTFKNISFLNLTIVYGPDYLCLNNVSEVSKNRIIRSLELQIIELKQKVNLQNASKLYDQVLNTIKGKGTNLQSIFIQKTEMFDTIRKENWKETFPELAEVLNV